MKIILTQDVPGVGKKREVKEVKGGYGRNYLLANGLAVLATPKTIKDAKLKQEQESQKRAVRKDLLEKSIESLQDFTFVVEKKANEKGHLYDAVDIREIAGLLKEKFPPKADQPLAEKMEIPLEYIKLEKPIKEIGKHKITVQKGDSNASFEVEIKPKED